MIMIKQQVKNNIKINRKSQKHQIRKYLKNIWNNLRLLRKNKFHSLNNQIYKWKSQSKLPLKANNSNNKLK